MLVRATRFNGLHVKCMLIGRKFRKVSELKSTATSPEYLVLSMWLIVPSSLRPFHQHQHGFHPRLAGVAVVARNHVLASFGLLQLCLNSIGLINFDDSAACLERLRLMRLPTVALASQFVSVDMVDMPLQNAYTP